MSSRLLSSALLVAALLIFVYLIRMDVWGYFHWVLNVIRGNV